MGSSQTKGVPEGTAVAVPVKEPRVEVQTPIRRRRRRNYGFGDNVGYRDDQLYCLMLTLLALCGAGVLICVLVAGIIYASQVGGG